MKTTRYIAKCSCGTLTSTLASSDAQRVLYVLGGGKHAEGTEVGGLIDMMGALAIRCRACGTARRVKAVVGKLSAKHVCNAKCLSSRSGVCECSCGGKNHGASYAA